MSSYRGEVGAWDGGPPGAEADYAPQPPPAPLPTTDPWTGVSYSQYGAPQYDYQGYGAPAYGYSYDSTYYQRPDGGYYDSSASTYPPPQPESYDYVRPRERSRSPHASRDYERRRPSYRSKSRSVSPYERRQREYSKRDPSYEDSRWRRRSRSTSKTKYSKYSSSDRSSYKSRSYSRSPKKIKKERRSSSESSRSGRSYKKPVGNRNERSLTPPLKNKTYSRNRSRSNNDDRAVSQSKYKQEKVSKSKGKSVPYYESKERRERDVYTPPRKNVSDSPKTHKKSNKSVTPPGNYKRTDRSPQRKKNYKDRKSLSPKRKPRDSSVTPPRCYARSRSTSISRSHSRSVTPKTKNRRSSTPKSRRSRSSSSSRSSASSASSRSKRRDRRKSTSKHRSRSKSRPRGRSVSKGRSKSPRSSSRFKGRRSRSPAKSKSRSRSRSSRLRSPSHSGTPSDEECRGQFTVQDRKRFWKMHKCRQEQVEKSKTPPKEVIPPPGAMETTYAYDVEYGDPPEVEGPNFAELLPPPDKAMQAPSTSKQKPIAIPIKNDGSFLEMFKKMQEETKKIEEKKPEIKKPVLPFIGKRRGGRVLKTGLVKKAKAIDEQTVDNTPKDAWSLYMQEVKKYRETSCEEERKTRPLVK